MASERTAQRPSGPGPPHSAGPWKRCRSKKRLLARCADKRLNKKSPNSERWPGALNERTTRNVYQTIGFRSGASATSP